VLDDFRYHPLFADFLRQVQAEVNQVETPGLHRQAALWLAGNGILNEAFRHALASRDVEWTVDMIERKIVTIGQARAECVDNRSSSLGSTYPHNGHRPSPGVG
jgi:LuxR family maltose regulon positive regulatory protein